MTGATEAVTPEQRAREIAFSWGGVIMGVDQCDRLADEIIEALREAEANALKSAAETAEAWLSRSTQFPAHYRYHHECARAHDEQIAGTGDAIRSLLSKEAGK